jgi:hypothetical protein
LGLLIALLPSAAEAQQQRTVVSRPQEAMRFTLAEGTGPKGVTRWIAAAGQIKADTPKTFAAFAAANRLDGLTVVLDSPGGSVNGGMALGREIRRLKLGTAVARTLETGTGSTARHRVDDSGAQCNSACVLVLIGGERREVTRRAHVGVHLFSGALRPDGTRAREVPTVQDIEDAQRTMVRHAIYVRDMGVDLGLLELMAQAPFKDMRRIQPAELEKLKVASLVSEIAVAPTVETGGWSYRRSAENPVLSRTVPLLEEPGRVADQELAIACSAHAGFVLVTYRQVLRKLQPGADFIAINRVRLVAGPEDHLLSPRLPLIARRQGDDLWLRRETPMALIEAALASRQIRAEPARNGATLPRPELFDEAFARFAPDLLKTCRARPGLSTIGLHPRH